MAGDTNRTKANPVIEILASIDAPPPANFCCGIVLWDDVVIEAAPIVGYMKKQKWSRDRVRDYCNKRGWKIEVVHRVERRDTRHKPA